ncbi:hypothetical protein KL949_002690 [Ogataea haglerorum]|nr:hypothetical protein KL913_002452 [Ogataea haglerorum]KAG7718694.1 hypothetical protein KL949_002690 [Ogataea haglerorum]KAG7743267.1 hypothetical protein KL932_002008 [Ogataea haglerorum]KAG7766997.1 hypothetical protein KL931_003881 [Ogataea haglerorum]
MPDGTAARRARAGAEQARSRSTRGWLPQDPRPRYLGPSSGVNFTRSVLSMASTLNIVQPKQSPKSDSPAPEHERLLPEVLLDQREPPGVPDKEALFVLFEKYRASQNVYGILNLQLFTECCDLYLSQRPPPAHAELVIRMVLSIAYTALHQSSRQALFSSLSTQSFDRAIQLYKQVLTTDTYNDWMLISTLMLLEHSLVNPGNPIVWYLVGIAVGFCARERYYSAELPLTNLQKRLFWTTYAFDRVVNHTLGRPSLLDDRYISVGFPEAVQADEVFRNYVFKMRTMQSRAINMTYHQTEQYSAVQVSALTLELELWKQNALRQLQDPQSRNWILYAYHMFKVSIFRPSPAVPQPSQETLEKCARSTSCSLKVYEAMIRSRTVDSTWISTHWLFVSCITYFYCVLTLPPLQQRLSKVDMVLDWNRMCYIFTVMSERWASVEGFLDIIRPFAEEMTARVLDDGAPFSHSSDFDLNVAGHQYISQDNLNYEYLLDDIFYE